ncbi:MAG: hypothetical protein R2726_06050 [Acidimicrobiales bacterium]
MADEIPELSSVASQLDGLVERVAAAAERAEQARDEAMAADLYEVGAPCAAGPGGSTPCCAAGPERRRSSAAGRPAGTASPNERRRPEGRRRGDTGRRIPDVSPATRRREPGVRPP